MLSNDMSEQVEAQSVTGVFECTTLLDVFLPIKVKKCKEQRSSSSLPNLLSLMKAFVSEREEEL